MFVYVALFTSLIFPHWDKDWGWHYRYGEYLLTHGEFLIRDIYSWTMSGYAWINHSWGFDPIVYFLTNTFGFMGLSLVNAGIVFLSFYFLTKSFKLGPVQLSILAFFFYQITETGVFEGLRSQSLALLPLSLIMYLLIKGKENTKYLKFLPLVLFVFANLHGSFVLGAAITAVFLGIYFFQYPDRRWKLVLIGAASVLITLINPFTYHSYLEVFRHTGNPYLQNVTEWRPPSLSCSDCHVPTFAAYIVLLVLAFFALDKRFGLPFAIVAIPLIWESVTARRYLPLFGVATLPLFAEFLSVKGNKILDIERFKIVPFALAFVLFIVLEYNLFIRLPAANFYKYNEYDYCNYSSKCSPDLVKYLMNNPPAGYGLNFYDWGGYFIYKQVPFKLFVDGRMHLWRGKGYGAFADYIEVYYHKDEAKFKEYDFDWVIAYPDAPVVQMIKESKGLGSWRIQYQDQYSVYFVRER